MSRHTVRPEVENSTMRSTRTTSPEIGQKIGRWTVVAPMAGAAAGFKSRAMHWLCKCDCETSKIVRQDRLMNGKSKSCGCLRAELSSQRETTHGHSKGRQSPTYQI